MKHLVLLKIWLGLTFGWVGDLVGLGRRDDLEIRMDFAVLGGRFVWVWKLG